MADEGLSAADKKAELETQKKILSLAELQLEVDRVAARDNLSAKKKDQLFQKLLNDNMAGTKALLSEGGNISKLSTGMQKAFIDSYRATGEEIDDRDERRSRETKKELIEIAFQTKKGNILDALANKEITEGQANLKLAMLETGNFFQKGWQGFQDKMADASDIKNLGSAISQDFSMLTTEFQGIMALPGMKTIITGIKFVAAWLSKWLGKKLLARWKARDTFMRSKKSVDDIVAAAPGVPLKDDGTPDMRYKVNKMKKDGLIGAADTKDTAGLAKKGKTPVPLAAAPATAAVAGAGAAKGPGKMGMRMMKRTMKRLTRAIKQLSRGVKRLVKLLLAIFGPAILASLAAGAKKFMFSVGAFLKKAMVALFKAFMWAAAGLLKMAKRMMIVIGQFLAAAYAFIVGTLLPAIVAFLMNPMTWIVIGIIALLILIAVAWYFLITYMMDNWEKIKVRMAMAVDRLKLVGTKIANWFKDLGSDIGFLIKKMVAKIKDGFVWIVNATIEGFAKAMPDGPVGRRAAKKIRSFKMKGGYSDEVDADWNEAIDKRAARDEKLEADFEAKYAERGKQLEEAKIKDSERKAGKGTATGGDINAPTITEIDQRQVYQTTESTEIDDATTAAAVTVVQ
jgi:hypothetical protein